MTLVNSYTVSLSGIRGTKKRNIPLYSQANKQGTADGKGVADMMAAILLVIIVLFFLLTYLSAINSELNKRSVINLREVEIANLAGTYSLLNKSLSMTWYISTVQALFNTADQSLLCGTDEPGITGDVMPPKYVYNYDREKARQIRQLYDYMQKRDTGQLTGKDDKYFGATISTALAQPAVCYPLDKDALDTLIFNFVPYRNIPTDFSANNIQIKIDRPSINTSIVFNNAGILSETEELVSLKSTNANIAEEIRQPNQIYTEFQKMVDFSRRLVQALAQFADTFTDDSSSDFTDTVYDPRLKYVDLNAGKISPLLIPDVGFESYLSRISSFFDSNVSAIKQGLGAGFTKTFVDVRKNQLELIAAKDSDSNVFTRTPFPNAGGVILHYDYSFNLVEGSAGQTNTCNPAKREPYLLNVQNAVRLNSWKFGDIEFSEDEMTAFTSAIIQQESNWDIKAISACGAVGLGQLMPDTALASGINYVFNPSTYSGGCDQTYAASLKQAASNKFQSELEAMDERFNADRNIFAGVNFIKGLMDHFSQNVKSKDELLKLTAAAYNTGQGNVDKAIGKAVSDDGADATDIKLDQIKNYLFKGSAAQPKSTYQYALEVAGHYICFGGVMASVGDLYYYHDEKDNKFYKKPVSMELKAQDYLPAIDCEVYGPGRGPYDAMPDVEQVEKDFFNSVRMYSWQNPFVLGKVAIATPSRDVGSTLSLTYHNMAFGDVACCGGQTWSCDADVPNMPDRNKLSHYDDITQKSTFCRDELNKQSAGRSNPVVSYNVVCCPGGFRIVSSTGSSSQDPCA